MSVLSLKEITIFIDSVFIQEENVNLNFSKFFSCTMSLIIHFLLVSKEDNLSNVV